MVGANIIIILPMRQQFEIANKYFNGIEPVLKQLIPATSNKCPIGLYLNAIVYDDISDQEIQSLK